MANNIKGNAPNAVVAKTTTSFVDAGITGTNTEIIYLVDDPLKSYVPGRAINGITGFEANKGYYIVAKLDMDLTANVVPPVSGVNQLAAPGSFTATPAGSAQINLSWAAVTNATGYVVDRATNSGFTTGVTLAIYTGNGTSYNNTGLTANTTYYYRIRATAPGYTDSNYSTANGATSAVGATPEALTWAQLVSATNDGGGDLTCVTGPPSGGTATKHLVKANGNYVEMTMPGTLSNAQGAVLVLCEDDDANYTWNSAGNEIKGSIYEVSGTLYSGTGDTAGTPTNLGAVNAADIVRLEVSGNDILVKKSTNGGTSFSTLTTHSNVLTGLTQMFIKGIFAIASAGIQVNNATGAGVA